jgi:hypothetical protein
MAKNICGKMVKKENAYEVWQSKDGECTWYVLKKYKSPEAEKKDNYARWFCLVTSPVVPNGEYGDVYICDIINNAKRIK